MPPSIRLSGLVLLLLVTPGCDLLTGSDLLDGPSSSDRSDLEQLTGDFFDCDADVQTLTDRESGTLESGDCLQSDDSYQDFYAFRLDETAEVEIEMESDDLAPYLFLLAADLDDSDPLVEVARDRNTDGDGRASIRTVLSRGLYLVYANSVSADETGDYTLTAEATAEDEDDRPAARPAAAAPAGPK